VIALKAADNLIRLILKARRYLSQRAMIWPAEQGHENG